MNHKPIIKQSFFIAIVTALALSSCQSTPSSTPHDAAHRAHLHYQLGLEALHQNMLPKAFSELIQANDLLPDQPETLDALAYAWRMRGDFEQSERLYQQAISHHPDSAIYNNYANLLLEMKRYDDAKVQLDIALNDPTYAHQDIAYTNLGDVLIGMGQRGAAQHAYQIAINIEPQQRSARLKLARSFIEQGDKSSALTQYMYLLKQAPADMEPLQEIVVLLKQQQHWQQLRTLLRHAQQEPIASHDMAWIEDELTSLERAEKNDRSQ